MKQAPSFNGRSPSWLERAGAQLRRAPVSPGLRRSLRRWFHSLLMWKSGGRGLVCALPGAEQVRVLPEFRYLAWNLDEYAAFRAAARPGMTALDIGANVGAYSLLLGQWVGPDGRVCAFEPAPASFAALRRHLELNRLEGIVTALPMAVCDRVGDVTMLAQTSSGANRLATAGDPSADGVTVTATTIDAFCAERKLTPQFIKIDVEGFELAVLRGARATLERCRDDLSLFVEFHPAAWASLGLPKADLLAELARLRLRVEPLAPGADPWAVEGVCARLVPG